MTRTEMKAVFLATLDELATHPHYDGGKPDQPRLGSDTIDIFLESFNLWGGVRYAALRAMFATLIEHLEMHDAERLFAAVTDELETAERCTAEYEAEKRADREARDAALVETIERWRVEDPSRFGRAMQALARIEAKHQTTEAVQ